MTNSNRQLFITLIFAVIALFCIINQEYQVYTIAVIVVWLAIVTSITNDNSYNSIQKITSVQPISTKIVHTVQEDCNKNLRDEKKINFNEPDASNKIGNLDNGLNPLNPISPWSIWDNWNNSDSVNNFKSYTDKIY